MKRANPDGGNGVSPPPVKRKIESTTTSKAVATFFKPASKKEPEQLTWRVVNQSLVIGKYEDPSMPRRSLNHPVRIAAFDLDDTIITPASKNNKWTRSATSWKWWNTCVPGRLKELYNQGYLVILISNQSTISLKDDPKKLQKDSLSLLNFKTQVTSVLRQLDFPISIYAATGHDRYRKPRTGMWEEMVEDFDLEDDSAIDKQNSFYVGDAAGREKTENRPKDHASSDRDLAANIGIRFYTPEEYFLSVEPEPYNHNFEPVEHLDGTSSNQNKQPVVFKQINPQELVIFCGSPGAGKSSFYWNVLQPLGYERVNQDILKTRDRCLKAAREHLIAGKCVAVDNTNADLEVRAHWIKLARELKVPIRCVRFTASTRLCEHNDNVRAMNSQMNPESRTLLPGIAFRSFAQRFVEPSLKEGLQDITEVAFQFSGTPEQREIWSKYWVSKFAT